MNYLELTLCAVQESVTTELSIRASGSKDKLTRGNSIIAMMKYCFGWGVLDEPPEEHDLYSIFNAVTLREKRAVWVQHEVCVTQDNMDELMMLVLMFGDNDEEE